MKKTKLILTSLILTSLILIGVFLWFYFSAEDTNFKIIEKRINFNFEVIESKKNKGFLDNSDYYSLILLDDYDYQELSDTWKPQPSQNFDKTYFIENFSSFSDLGAYKRIESGDFMYFSIFTLSSQEDYTLEYYFFMGNGKIAVFSYDSKKGG